MALRGELREFELPDILQLIASQQKAGWLKVISGTDCHFVFFRDGRITSTKNPAEEEEDPLENYIIRRGLLTHEQIERVAATRRKTGMDVHDILQKEGLLQRDEIQEIFEAMVEQDVFELMSIRSGTYEFETEDRPGPVPEGALYAEIGPILMEGARKADEVAEMRRALGPEDGVLALTGTGREAHPRHEDEATVLALVNAIRPIDTILEESDLDRYTATRTLFDCARQGWVKLIRTGRSGSDADAGTDAVFDPRRAVRWAAPVLAILALTILFSNGLQRFRRPDPILGEYLQRAKHLETAGRHESVRLAVEAWRAGTGSYPQSLDALVQGRLLPETSVTGPDGDRWAYDLLDDSSGFTLATAPARVEGEDPDAY